MDLPVGEPFVSPVEERAPPVSLVMVLQNLLILAGDLGMAWIVTVNVWGYIKLLAASSPKSQGSPRQVKVKRAFLIGNEKKLNNENAQGLFSHVTSGRIRGDGLKLH